jgi:hypothetical protein
VIKKQVDAVVAQYNVVKEHAPRCRWHLSLPQSFGGSGYMGQIENTYLQLAQAAAEEVQAHMNLDVSLGNLRSGGR